MKKFLYYLPSIIFNIVETLLIFVSSYILKLSLTDTITILASFSISRFIFKLPKHFKEWQKCLIWTLVLFSSLFIVVKVNMTLSILCTVFCAYILSGKADIRDMFQWYNITPNEYEDIEDFIKYHRYSQEITEFEEKLQNDKDRKIYLIYRARFYENKNYEQIMDMFDIRHKNTVNQYIKSIALSFRTNLLY